MTVTITTITITIIISSSCIIMISLSTTIAIFISDGEPADPGYSAEGGAVDGGVQWIGVVLYNKLV